MFRRSTSVPRVKVRPSQQKEVLTFIIQENKMSSSAIPVREARETPSDQVVKGNSPKGRDDSKDSHGTVYNLTKSI